MSMRLLFLGSGEFGLPTLDALVRRHEVVAVVTQPDRPAGRRREMTGTPVAQWAAAHGLPVLKLNNINTPDARAQIAGLAVEASVVIAFGQKIGPEVLGHMGALAVNLHASLLPRHRGASPIHHAILHGDSHSGVCVIGLAQRMDAGDIYASRRTPIDPQETAGELHDRLAALGPEAVLAVLDDLAGGTLNPQPQDDRHATLAPKLSREDAWVRFNQKAEQIRRRVHGLTPWPGVSVPWAGADPTRPVPMLKLLRVRIGDNFTGPPPGPGSLLPDGQVAAADRYLQLLELQLPGGRPLPIDQFLRGHVIRDGDRLESTSIP